MLDLNHDGYIGIDEWIKTCQFFGVEQSIAEKSFQQLSTNNKLEEDTEQSLDEFKEDVRGAETLARATDETVADTQRELRDDVYAMEEKLNERMRQMDEDLRAMRGDLEEKIEMILDNPLNDVE